MRVFGHVAEEQQQALQRLAMNVGQQQHGTSQQLQPLIARHVCRHHTQSETYSRQYYYHIIRTLGTATDKIDRRTDRHTENKHKTTHYR